MGQRPVVQSARNTAATAVTVTPTDSDIYTALGQWLRAILPTGFEVLQGQINQTPAPNGPFVTMTIITRPEIGTNSWIYTETQRLVTKSVRLGIQISLFGSGAGNAAQQVIPLWRDMNAADFMSAYGIALRPLYAGEPRQTGFINGEKQYEDQWSFDLSAHVNFTVAVTQQFATKVILSTTEADGPTGATTTIEADAS